MNPIKKKEGRKLLTLGVLLAIVNGIILLSVLSYTIYKSFAGDDSSTVEVGDIDFTSPNTSNQSPKEAIYYNPTLGFSFKYDSSKYDVLTENGQTKIYVKGSPSVTVEANISTLEKTENDPISNRIAFFESQYGGVRKEEQATVESLPFARISYSTPSISGEGNRLIVNSEIVYIEVNGMYVYLMVSHSPSYNSVSLLSDLSKTLQTISFDRTPEELVQRTSFANGLLELDWDGSMWDNKWESDSITLLKKNEPESSSYFYSYPSKENSDRAQIHKNYISEQSLTYPKDEFELIQDGVETTIEEFDFLYSQYAVKGDSPYVAGILTTTVEDRDIIIKVTAPTLEELETTKEPLNTLRLIAKEETDVLGASSVTQVEKAAIIGRPAVVRVLNVSCATVKFSEEFEIEGLKGKEYSNLCSSGLGSGFFVGDSGHIITNGHVSTPHPLDVLINSYKPNSRFWKEYSEQSQKHLIEAGYESLANNQPGLASILSLGLAEFYDEGLIDVKSTNANYIELDSQFEFDLSTNRLLNQEDQTKAEVVAGATDSFYRMLYKELIGEGARITTADMALLKIKSDSSITYPGLSLAKASQIIPGQKVVVIGFPAVASSQVLFSAQSSAIATVTSGSLNAVRQNPTGVFNLIQVDATISQGNSGGPILSSEGAVLGVATYQISQSEVGYNAGISAEEILKLMSDNQVQLIESKVTKEIEEGLGNFSKNYYTLAVKNFNSAKTGYPLSAKVLDPLIAQANEKISQGEDSSPSKTLLGLENEINQGFGLQLSGTTTVYIVLAFVGLLLALIVLVIVRIRNRIKSKDSTPSVIGNPDASTASTFVQIPPVTGPTPNIPTVPLPQIQPIPSQQNPIPMQESPVQPPNLQPPQRVDQPVQTTQVNQETVQPNITPTVTLTSQPQSPTQVESNPQPIPPQSQI